MADILCGKAQTINLAALKIEFLRLKLTNSEDGIGLKTLVCAASEVESSLCYRGFESTKSTKDDTIKPLASYLAANLHEGSFPLAKREFYFSIAQHLGVNDNGSRIHENKPNIFSNGSSQRSPLCRVCCSPSLD